MKIDTATIMQIRNGLANLTALEFEVFSLRFFQRKTLTEISCIIRRTKERCQQISEHAQNKMQTAIQNKAVIDLFLNGEKSTGKDEK